MPPTVHQTMTPSEWALLIALSVLWGGSFLFIAVAVTELPPVTVVAVRVAIGAALLYLVVRAVGRQLPTGLPIWAAFAGMGILNNVIPFSLIAWGQTQIPGGLASILNATTPFFTVIVAHLFTRDERMTFARVIGVIIGFGGVAIMMGVDLLADVGQHLWAQLAILGAGLSYALSAVYARRFSRLGQPPLVSAAGQFIAAAVMMIPLSLVFDHPWSLPAPSWQVVGSVVALGALSSCLAYIIYYRILATAGAVNLMLVTFLVPVSAILLGSLVLGERLSAHHFLGMAAIGFGLAVIDGRPLATLRRRLAA
ncbi:DMT family transporter [Bauldia sp.]|uniref:DMT family transporter n=1 Tax=Bauldia sp. TaxID=2575872 RepID=UPI003BADA5CE